MRMKKILALTALKEGWGVDEEVIFLGEWCKDYREKSSWESRKHTTLNHHWEDRIKLAKDYHYLAELYENIFQILSKELSKETGIKYEELFWRVVIGPWLLHQIAVLFDRWETVNAALESHYTFDINKLIFLKPHQPATDYSHFHLQIQDHSWNQFIYQEILTFMGVNFSSHIEMIDESKKKSAISIIAMIKAKVKSALNKLISAIAFNSEVFLFQSYLSFISQLKLSISIKQAAFDQNKFNWNSKRIENLSAFRKSIIEINPTNNFEIFLKNCLCQFIPINYLELISYHLQIASNISTRAKVIFTANGHYSNDLFKIWVADQVCRLNKRLVISEHGSSFPLMGNQFDHEVSIGRKITWSKPTRKNEIQLSPNLLIGKKKIKPLNKGYLSVIGLEMPLYTHRCEFTPLSSLILKDFDQKIDFMHSLNEEIRKKVLYKPYSDRGWHLADRLQNIFNSSIQISEDSSLASVIKKSRLIVCTYPMTTFSEAMTSGVPTILLCLADNWEIDPEFAPLWKKLVKSKIIFSNAELAANHIEEIWDAPNSWWDSHEIKLAREDFLLNCCDVVKNWEMQWANAILQNG